MVFGNCGILSAKSLSSGKGYIEMTSIDAETSKDIYEALTLKGGRYLEAQIQGSKSQAEEGTLIILAAGDRGLFEECQTCFEAMGRNSFFLGDVGNASKMNLVLQTMAGVTLAALAESMALGELCANETARFVLMLVRFAQLIGLDYSRRMYWRCWSSPTCLQR